MKNLLRLAMFLPLALIYTTCPMKRQLEVATESKKAKNNLLCNDESKMSFQQHNLLYKESYKDGDSPSHHPFCNLLKNNPSF